MKKERNQTIIFDCPRCGHSHTIDVNLDDWIDYVSGNGLAQDIFTYLTPTEREQMISNLCPSCQQIIFGFEDEEEEEDEGDDIYICMTESLGNNWW